MSTTGDSEHGREDELMHDGDQPGLEPADDADGTVDFLYLVDRLEELVGVGKRVPFSHRVMVEEAEFLAIVDQLRVTVPNEIRQAQRVIREREAIIIQAQDEAAKILDVARQQAEYIVSQQGVLNEARQRGEELLQQVEVAHRRSIGQIDDYAIQQFTRMEEAMQDGVTIILDAVREASTTLDQAKRHVGQ
ncbi:MAG: ATPase [Chloroflexota bacterium]|nr:ATPase [Chloroflexota bacterium]